MKLQTAIDALLLATEVENRSAATLTDYRNKLKPMVDYFGEVEVETITADALRHYVKDLRDRDVRWEQHPKLAEKGGRLSPFSIAGYVRAFKRLFNWLEAEGALADNPSRRIKNAPPKSKLPKAVSLEDFMALLKTTEPGSLADVRDRAIILLLADSGCRVGGLCNLTVETIHLETRLATTTEKGGEVQSILFSDVTADAIRQWLKVRPARGASLFVSLGNKCSGGFSRCGVEQMLKRRAKLAGIAGRVNPHSFRHAFAREYLMNGGDLATLCEIMGHSSVDVTKAFYAIFTIKELQEKHGKFSPVARMGNP